MHFPAARPLLLLCRGPGSCQFRIRSGSLLFLGVRALDSRHIPL